MSLRILVVVCVLASWASPGRHQSDCEPPVWGDEVVVFNGRIRAYLELRDGLDAGIRSPDATSTAELGSTRRALVAKIRQARVKARQGDVFSPAIASQIKRSLRRVLDSQTWKVIMDDNPGEQPSQVNDPYREGSPLTTMPPNVLAALPKLPESIEYRFVERHLILLDSRALVIIDRVPFAILDPHRDGHCK